MGKKIIVTVNNLSLSLSAWARKLGVSRQRIWVLYKRQQLERYINGERYEGRPMKVSDIRERIEKSGNLTVKELSAELGLSEATVYRYKKDVEDSKRDR